jgi:hypothetical protein
MKTEYPPAVKWWKINKDRNEKQLICNPIDRIVCHAQTDLRY